jgi:putative addiction module killer protein
MRVQMTEVYRDWINSLTDRAGRARVQVRVDRLVHGNPGQHRVLTDGVCELKVDFGTRVPGVLHGAHGHLDRPSRRR